MAIPKLKKQDIIAALKFIDENGVPEHNTSVKYLLQLCLSALQQGEYRNTGGTRAQSEGFSAGQFCYT